MIVPGSYIPDSVLEVEGLRVSGSANFLDLPLNPKT